MKTATVKMRDLCDTENDISIDFSPDDSYVSHMTQFFETYGTHKDSPFEIDVYVSIEVPAEQIELNFSFDTVDL